MANETINITTRNGNVTIVRTNDKATITQQRTCLGFKETTVINVTKLDDSCMHYAFGDEKDLNSTFKND